MDMSDCPDVLSPGESSSLAISIDHSASVRAWLMWVPALPLTHRGCSLFGGLIQTVPDCAQWRNKSPYGVLQSPHRGWGGCHVRLRVNEARSDDLDIPFSPVPS